MIRFIPLPASVSKTADFQSAFTDHNTRSRFGLKECDVYLTILFQNDQYQLEGLNTGNCRYPIVLRSLSTNQLIGVSEDVVTLIGAARAGYDLRISA